MSDPIASGPSDDEISGGGAGSGEPPVEDRSGVTTGGQGVESRQSTTDRRIERFKSPMVRSDSPTTRDTPSPTGPCGHRTQSAIEAVRMLHVKVHDGYLGQDVCSHCSDEENGRWATWPCRTIATIEEALDGR